MRQTIRRHPMLVFFAMAIIWIWISMPALFALYHLSVTFSVTFFGLPSSATAAGELRGTLINTAIQVLVAPVIVIKGIEHAKSAQSGKGDERYV